MDVTAPICADKLALRPARKSMSWPVVRADEASVRSPPLALSVKVLPATTRDCDWPTTPPVPVKVLPLISRLPPAATDSARSDCTQPLMRLLPPADRLTFLPLIDSPAKSAPRMLMSSEPSIRYSRVFSTTSSTVAHRVCTSGTWVSWRVVTSPYTGR